MDQSPPKRVTRARAAAKTTDTGLKTTKIATAASKAKVTRAAATSTKRKTRADDVDVGGEEQQQPEEIIESEIKTTRGRPKRVVQSEEVEEEKEMNEPPVRSTRGRPKKDAVEPPVPTSAPAPAKTTRGRAKKIDVPAEEAIVVEEPVKRPTRARATTVSKAPAPKKSVKFEEPDKENIPIEITAKGKAKAEPATGLRAKPVRKPAAAAATTTARATRGRAKNTVEEKTSPLSPKKATQVATAKEPVSEDELATMEKTPMKPLMKSPMKPPSSVFGTAKKLDFGSNTITAHRAIMPVAQDLKGSIIGSPARRPPQSPFKESMKASAQKMVIGNSMLQSPFKPSLPAPKSEAPISNAAFKASLLQSPARRPQSPTKVTDNGSPSRSTNTNSLFAGTPKASTFKISRFATPRTINKSAVRPGQMPPPSVRGTTSTGSPSAAKDDSDATMTGAEPSLSFSGRLSSIMPREADADLAFAATEPIEEETADILSVIATPTFEMPPALSEQLDESMVEASDTIVFEELMEHTTTPPMSPSPVQESSNVFSTAFSLRDTNDNPFHDDSESEDELASGSPSYSPVPLTGFKTSSHDFASSPATPTPFTAISKTPKTVTASRPSTQSRSERQSKIGFTPLARQLSDWMAASPEKSDAGSDEEPTSPTSKKSQRGMDVDATPKPSPAKSSFFDDEMSVRDDAPEPAPVELDLLEVGFEPVDLDEEDMALAYEADEMSMLEPDEIEAHVSEEMFQEHEEIVVVEPEQEVLAVEQDADHEATFHAIMSEQFDSAQEELVQVESADYEMVDQLEFAEVTVPEEEMVRAPEPAAEEVHDFEIVQDSEPAPSEASQEYGDENAMPIDPVLLALPAPQSPARQSFATPRPKRVLAERVCHTVSKVPLKPAAEDSPMQAPPKKRSASISRLPVQRPTSGLSRSNTVISYSPSKNTPRSQSRRQTQDIAMEDAVATPSKTEGWSNMGTPARTPRRDINTALLKGAVVFVDVHTSEGSDASALFTELLTQMGARCVKSWTWNGNAEDTSKIGITHVVFKDGGKRTLEKAKETNGVVSCVGVGWVLE